MFANRLRIDGHPFHRVRPQDIPQSWVSVDVQIHDTYHGHGVYMTTMIAGSVGMEFTASGDREFLADTVEPLSG
jgi:Domain of unknown function (DUF4419)